MEGRDDTRWFLDDFTSYGGRPSSGGKQCLIRVGSYGLLSSCDSDQQVADGLVGPYVARGPVGSYGMLSLCDCTSDPDQLVADGPVGPYVARGPVGSYGMLSPFDSNQLVADGPVGPYIARGPVGSYGMLSHEMLSPPRMATMDQYLPRNGAPFGGGGSCQTLLFCLGLGLLGRLLR